MSFFLIDPAKMNIGWPVMGGVEAKVEGRWALTADRHPFTATADLWMASLCGLQLHAAIRKDVGQLYARPFGWAKWVEEQVVCDEDGEVLYADEAHWQHVVGAELVDSSGESYSWAVELVRLELH